MRQRVRVARCPDCGRELSVRGGKKGTKKVFFCPYCRREEKQEKKARRLFLE
jgi:ssDNA-binding Zn-finger/Zn-ribbon topoisomerase 1